MGLYFDKYKLYYECLNGKQLLSSAKSLGNIISTGENVSKTNYFSKIKSSRWSESAKSCIVNNIFSNISTNLLSISKSINSNLVGACGLAETLFEQVSTIKSEDDILEQMEKDLADISLNLYNTPPKIIKRVSIKGKLSNVEYDNPEYTRLVDLQISKKQEISSQTAKLEELCATADEMIGQILSLNTSSNSSGNGISLANNYNNFFGDIDIEALREQYGDDYEGLAIELASLLRLPEGFTLINSKYSEKSRFGITDNGNGLVVNVSYRKMSGALYIPLDNSTKNLGIIMGGNRQKIRYDSACVHIFDENDFDSVVFFPNHINDNEASYNKDHIKILASGVTSLKEFYGLETITGNAHSNGCKDMANLIVELSSSGTSFSRVLLMNPSSYILKNNKAHILKDNNVTILTGSGDALYHSGEQPAKEVVEDYASIGGAIFIQDSDEKWLDKFETNGKKHSINGHWCRWFTYLGGSFTDSNNQVWTMKNNIDLK